jgi:protein O-GlcNAc transferase
MIHDRVSQLIKSGQYEEAERLCRMALRERPDDAEAVAALALVLGALGLRPVARKLSNRAVTLEPANPLVHRLRAATLRKCGDFAGAVESLNRTVELAGATADDLANLGELQRDRWHLSDALGTFERALFLKPGAPRIQMARALTLLRFGDVTGALAVFHEVAGRMPGSATARSCFAFCLNYVANVTPGEAREAANAWARDLGSPSSTAFTRVPRHADGRRLRLGYLSSDLGEHPVGRILAPVLAHHDHDSFEIYCYSTQPYGDALERRMRADATAWRTVNLLTDEQLVHQIRGDQIDILIDLCGHSGNHRLRALSNRVAPVQVTWLGYFAAIGGASSDYLLGDRYVLPPDQEGFYTERLARLPDSFLVAPTPSYVDRDEVSSDSNRCFAFGSLNNISKITDDVIRLWSDILGRVPHSQLVLKHLALDDIGARDRLMRAFAAQGIEASRLVMRGSTTLGEHIDMYSQIDVALDTFPYNGGMTTIDALSAGVPVVSLVGERFVSRMGLSILSNVNLPELVAWTPSEYRELAVNLATHDDRLQRMRVAVRERFPMSPLCDVVRFTKGLESTLRSIWDDYLMQV